MSASGVFFASLSGGFLERRLATRPSDKGQFAVLPAGTSFEPLTVFLSRAEAAQWASVLYKYSETLP